MQPHTWQGHSRIYGSEESIYLDQQYSTLLKTLQMKDSHIDDNPAWEGSSFQTYLNQGCYFCCSGRPINLETNILSLENLFISSGDFSTLPWVFGEFQYGCPNLSRTTS